MQAAPSVAHGSGPTVCGELDTTKQKSYGKLWLNLVISFIYHHDFTLRMTVPNRILLLLLEGWTWEQGVIYFMRQIRCVKMWLFTKEQNKSYRRDANHLLIFVSVGLLLISHYAARLASNRCRPVTGDMHLSYVMCFVFTCQHVIDLLCM